MDDRKEKWKNGSMNEWVNRWVDGQKDREMLPSLQPLWLWSSVFSQISDLAFAIVTLPSRSPLGVQYRRLSDCPPPLLPLMVLILLLSPDVFLQHCLSHPQSPVLTWPP